MRRSHYFGWAVAGMAFVALPHLGWAADKDSDQRLEERVRALEKKVNQTQRAEGAEKKTVKEKIEALEKDVADTKQSLTDKLGVEIHGLVAANYTYNFNTPASRTNNFHVFDQDANSIALDMANLHFQRTKPDGLGFVADVDFGKTAEVVSKTTQWRSNGNSDPYGLGGSSSSIDLRQAYLTYGFGGTPFSIQAGKFVTFHGAEVIKSYNNLNYNISNSILFGYAVPFTHTGIVGTYTLPSDMGSVSAGVVNGWDDVVDNNSSKSFTGQLTLTPMPMVTFNLATTYGAEQVDNGESKRFLVTPIVTIKPIDPLTFIVEYDYGNESNVQLSGGTIARAPGNAMWQGIAGYAIYAVNDALQVTLRSEVFDDPDGVRTGVQEFLHGPGVTLWEFTPTVAYKLTDGLTVRAEYRHDEADKRVFDKDNTTGLLRGQDLIATELIYAF